MASSKVMVSKSPPNQRSPRQPSMNLYSDQSRNFGSMNIDDMFRSIYSDPDSLTAALGDANRSRDGVAAAGEPGITLEDFLAKAGAVSEGDLMRVPAASVTVPQLPTADFGTITTGVPVTLFDTEVGGGAGGGGGRKRRRGVEELVVDKVAQQKHRRMIKNRESAARSRERKQAYTVELESLVTQLKEDNARLLKEEVELNKERYKQTAKIVSHQRKLSMIRSLQSAGSTPWAYGEHNSSRREPKTSKNY